MSQFENFKAFYPYYLAEHADAKCRAMHFIGTTLVLLTLVVSLVSQRYGLLFMLPIFGYGFAWFGHFVFEKNKPATFKHPFYSLMGDFVMYWDMLTGKFSESKA
ncbi:MAG: DUF962 domain-containing protein [Pseudomonadota bacterium]